jgi:hypothetical protein
MEFFRVVQIRPSDWDRRVEIVKKGDGYQWDFHYCRNCNKSISTDDFSDEDPVTGETLKCPLCNKTIMKWETSKNVGFESLVEPDGKGFKIVDRYSQPIFYHDMSITAEDINDSWSNTAATDKTIWRWQR